MVQSLTPDEISVINGIGGALLQKMGVRRCKLPSYIATISDLYLTPHGEARLCAYPDQSLQEALKSLREARKFGMIISNPFSFVEQLARADCKTRGISPNYAFVERYIKQHGINTNSPFLRNRVDFNKPLSQRSWTRPYSAPTATDFNQKKLSDHFLTDTWKKLQRSRLSVELHQYLMTAINEAERRTCSK